MSLVLRRIKLLTAILADCLYMAKWGMIEHLALLKEQNLPTPPENENPQVTIKNGEKTKHLKG